MPTHSREKDPQATRLLVPDGFSPEEVKDLSSVLNALLADTFALYLKTKNFHWHMSGQHFRDFHLLLDEQADQIFAITDAIAERARKVAAPPSAPSGTSPGCNGLPTTTRNMSAPRTCWRSSTPTTRRWCKACAQRMRSRAR